MVTCSVCGRSTDAMNESGAPLGWTSETGGERRTGWICPTCTRDHVRSIEAKLEQEWW